MFIVDLKQQCNIVTKLWNVVISSINFKESFFFHENLASKAKIRGIMSVSIEKQYALEMACLKRGMCLHISLLPLLLSLSPHLLSVSLLIQVFIA